MSGTKVQEQEADLVVLERTEIADGVLLISVGAPDGSALSSWTPGAHVDLVLRPDLVRQYSLCSRPADQTRYSVGVLLDPASRGGSSFVHESLAQGDSIRVRGPRNHFPLVHSPRYQFVAGGIGITPMLPMIEAAEAAGAEWQLLYGGRTRASMGFMDRLSAYGDRVTLWPQDEHGLLDLPGLLATPRDDTLVYSCGPEALLNALEENCAHWPTGALHIERFAARAPSGPAVGPETFEVVCQRSGLTITVGADETVFDALEEAGVSITGSCLEGLCGSCEAEVIEGTPDHRDSVLSEAEQASNEVMMVCVSRSLSPRLVLDL
jgi:ferredoxin-NADP reductase